MLLSKLFKDNMYIQINMLHDLIMLYLSLYEALFAKFLGCAILRISAFLCIKIVIIEKRKYKEGIQPRILVKLLLIN
jgi:hypothetical protein